MQVVRRGQRQAAAKAQDPGILGSQGSELETWLQLGRMRLRPQRKSGLVGLATKTTYTCTHVPVPVAKGNVVPNPEQPLAFSPGISFVVEV